MLEKSLWNEKVFLGEYLCAIFHSAPWQRSEAITWWISNHLDFKSNFPQNATIYLLPYYTAPSLLPYNDSNVATIAAIIAQTWQTFGGRNVKYFSRVHSLDAWERRFIQRTYWRIRIICGFYLNIIPGTTGNFPHKHIRNFPNPFDKCVPFWVALCVCSARCKDPVMCWYNSNE